MPNNFGFGTVDAVYEMVCRCQCFHCIISVVLTLFLPKQITGFFMTWEAHDAQLSNITFPLTTKDPNELKINLLATILKTYGLCDQGDVRVNKIDGPTLHTVYEEMVISPKKVFNLKTFYRMDLKPRY